MGPWSANCGNFSGIRRAGDPFPHRSRGGDGGGRGGIGLTPLSYSYAHETLLMASGRMRDALTQYVLWPPGYSLIAVPIVWLGVSPIRATWLISVAAFG